MFSSCGTMCKHVLLLISFCIFAKCQTVDHQRTTRLQSIRHEIFGNIEDSEITFPIQNSTTTNPPLDYANYTNEAELSPTTENSDGVEASTLKTPSTTPLQTEPTIKPELPMKTDHKFGDLDHKSLQLYSKLLQILNESQNLSSELDLGESKGVLLIGNSGSGKTTLVQLLAGNISNLEAKELYQDSGDYYIGYVHKINNGMGFSSPFSVNLVRDNETGVVFADYPGFRESIGAAEDLEIAMNMKVVAESFQKARIALVCPHSFLKKGTYRAAFTNFLERVADFLKNSEHHVSDITLIVTKVKSSYFYKKGQIQLVSDKAELKGNCKLHR
ncbi:uncharacterized protein LOC111053979 isoform X2 [Nilaparvata lugens]|uniref:uncharacterized protein LOC111053979 isoform X2 n=1 Tax=Nilaparvata lugens TaxID=108931 RepID=UPI00193E10BA|nr:uncharacterized protein LOC111053979 isoform X2 [Nilaparvata lugens]